MNRKVAFGVAWGVAASACLTLAVPHGRTRHAPRDFSAKIAGYQVKLVAVAEPFNNPRERHADHAWTPDGLPYEGPERRIDGHGGAPPHVGGTPRDVVFEIQPLLEKTAFQPNKPGIDAFAYLPRSRSRGQDLNPGEAGPVPIEVWQGGVPRDSAGAEVLAAPSDIEMGLGPKSTNPQPVVFGLAKGDYKVAVQQSVSVPKLDENRSAVIASGTWGKIEITHLPTPRFQSAPAPTHRLSLLGGPYPPKAERKVLFYNAEGKLVATCGDGPNNAGYAGYFLARSSGPADITRFEIEERPYEFAKFEGVSFEAPTVPTVSGDQGLERAIDSPVGKVEGVITPTKDGAWSGSLLYAADGTRWIDPGQELAGYEYGMFDPWNHPLDERWNILFEPTDEALKSSVSSCEVYAADSPSGPNREKLTSWNELPLRGGMSTIPCAPTNRPFVRLEVSLGSGTWRTLESIPIVDRKVSLGERIFEVRIQEDGGISTWTDGDMPVPSKHRWIPGRQRVRFLAHLRAGGTAELSNNTGGSSGTPPQETNRYHGISCTRQVNGATVLSGSKWIDAKEIASVDVQVQDYGQPVTAVLHSPRSD